MNRVAITNMRRAVPGLLAAILIVAGCGRAGPGTGDVATSTRSASSTPIAACAASGPSNRGSASAVFDAGRQVTVLFGGATAPPVTTNETWLFDGRCWQQAHPAISPAPRAGAGMAYNPVVDRTLLIGGRSQPPIQPDYPEDAWTWDGSRWTRVPGAPKLDYPVASFDEKLQVVVVFGWGPASVPETWTWDGYTWARKSSPNSPSVYSASAMCFDRSTRSILLYGGNSKQIEGGISAETWLWDGSAWSNPHPAHVPGPRSQPVMVCGPRIVLFGGLTGGYVGQQANVASDTWAWSGADWQRLPTTNAPPDCCGNAVYDGSKQMVFDTGRDGIPMWSWNGSDWAIAA